MAKRELSVSDTEAWSEEGTRVFAGEVARLCRGQTEVRGTAAGTIGPLLADRDVAVLQNPPGETPRTIVALFDSGAEAREGDLNALWDRLGNGGRLITCIRNTDEEKSREAFGVKGLKRLVRPFGRMRVQTGQPSNWLVSLSEKGISIDRHMKLRIAVTVDLCRGPVLELGSGAGHLSAEIARRGMDVRGVELASGKVATARELYPHITFEQGDILEIEEGSGHFGTVILAEVLEHVPDAVGQRMTDIAWSLVAPGGRLIVSVPNEDLIPHRNHVREFTHASLLAELSRYGIPKAEWRQPLRWLLAYVDRPNR